MPIVVKQGGAMIEQSISVKSKQAKAAVGSGFNKVSWNNRIEYIPLQLDIHDMERSCCVESDDFAPTTVIEAHDAILNHYSTHCRSVCSILMSLLTQLIKFIDSSATVMARAAKKLKVPIRESVEIPGEIVDPIQVMQVDEPLHAVEVNNTSATMQVHEPLSVMETNQTVPDFELNQTVVPAVELNEAVFTVEVDATGRHNWYIRVDRQVVGR